MVGVPYDIPIFIQMYRRDIFEELGLKPATTMEEFSPTRKKSRRPRARPSTARPAR